MFASFGAFCEREGLAPDSVSERFRDDPSARAALAQLETGALTVTSSSSIRLRSCEVEHERLIGGCSGHGARHGMIDGVAGFRAPACASA